MSLYDALIVGALMLASLLTFGYAIVTYVAELRGQYSVAMGLDGLFSARWLVASALLFAALMHALDWPYVGVVIPTFLLYAASFPVRRLFVGRYLGLDCAPLDKPGGFRAFQQRVDGAGDTDGSA